MAEAAIYHFQSKRKDLNQIDITTFHLEFINRSSAGPAEISIQELKLGQQFSFVRLQLLQKHTGKSRICIEATCTMGNMSREVESGGVSLPTKPMSSLRPIPRLNDCELWNRDPRWNPRRPGAIKIDIYLPRGTPILLAHPTLGPSVREQWVKWADHAGQEGFSIASLLYLADAFRPLPEAYGLKGKWFPTLSYGLDIKKAPPTAKGWEWLFLRIEMNVVSNGRYDLSVMIFDEEGELVAMGNHTALILAAARGPQKSGSVVQSKI